MAEATARAAWGARLCTHWPTVKRLLVGAFLALVIWLIVDRARTIDWPSVLSALRAYPLLVLVCAAALAAASHIIYCSYDLIGRRLTGHALTTMQVLRVAFVSYAFNLNLGSLVGGVAVRYRLYARLGLETGVVTRILGFSLITNWLGYLVLGGAVFLFRPLDLPPDWEMGSAGLRVLGALMLTVAAGYLAVCFVSHRRIWQVRGHAIELPSGQLALLQLGVSVLNWALIASVVWVLLQQRIDAATVLAVLLIAAVAGVIAHVPAGLGVLEAVFIALLLHRIGQGELLAALLGYRAIYYLAPLCVAAPLYFWFETRGGSKPATDPTDPSDRFLKPAHRP